MAGIPPADPNQYFTPDFGDLPQGVATHFRQLFLAINQHDQAIKLVHSMASTSKAGTTIINNTNSGGGGSNPILTGIGAVNNQTGVTSYTIQAIDNGAQVRFGDASPVTVTLNSALIVPFFTTLSNDGPSILTATPSTGTVNGLASITVSAMSWVTIYFDGVNWSADSPGAAPGGVNQIVAGTGVTISPVGGTGTVTIDASGSGGYSLGGVVTSANIVALGAGAGAGASVTLATGLDGNHTVEIMTGTTPAANSDIYTFNFTTTRGHVTYPILFPRFFEYTSFAQIPYIVGSSATSYIIGSSAATALLATTAYVFNVSCP